MINFQTEKATPLHNLTDRTTASLRNDILKGKYQTGKQLPAVKQLSETLGVSITVVREALSRLKSDGLISSRQGKGVFVENNAKSRPFRLHTTDNLASLIHIFELRMAVEVQAAFLAAQRRKQKDLRAMEQCLGKMRPNQNTFEAALAADIAFHLSIAAATRNPLIATFMEFLQPHLYESISKARATTAKSEMETIAYEDHHTIYMAIVKEDALMAATAMRRVLEGSLDRLKLRS